MAIHALVVGHRWRDYRTGSGRRPIKEFIDELSDTDAAEIAAAMKDVQKNGMKVARHLRGEIYEVRADGVDESYRLLFAQEGRRGRILLALALLTKHSQKTPDREIELAVRRLRDWRGRARKPRA